MNCEKCGASVFDKTLHRTKPKGQPDAGWMCLDCIKALEPELAKNIKEDDAPSGVLKSLEKIMYGKSSVDK